MILLLGGPQFATLEVEIYIQAMQMLNLPLAGLLSAIQLVCTLVLTIAYSRASRLSMCRWRRGCRARACAGCAAGDKISWRGVT